MPRYPESVINSWLNLADANRGTERFQVSLSAFRILVSGRIPSIGDIAGATGMSLDTIEPLVQSMSAEGRLTLDQFGGSITGAGGLSLVESRHELHMLERQYWVWCALDAVGIPAGLELDATVQSRCVDSDEPVEVAIVSGDVDRVRPSGLVISLIPPALDQSLHDCCCAGISFYSEEENAPDSAAKVTIQQAMQLGRRLWNDGIPL